MRRANAAISASCVTISTVMPRSRFSAASSSMISRLRCVSRLPVGSSASSTVGRGHDRARDRHALLLAAREFARRVVAPAVEADRGQRLGRRRMARLRALAAVEQRQLDVLLRRGARQQVEALEDEAEVAPAQARALVARQALDVHAAEQVLASVGVSRQPMTFIAVDLPEPLGPMMATNSPSSISRSMPASACSAVAPAP